MIAACRTFWLTLLAMLSACEAPTAPSTTTSTALGAIAVHQGSTSMGQDWARHGCEQPEPVSTFSGQSVAAVTAELGEPARSERFLLGEGMNEFRVELRNDLPLPANARLPVMEYSWAEGDCRLTAWAVERHGVWTVIRATRWPAGAEF